MIFFWKSGSLSDVANEKKKKKKKEKNDSHLPGFEASDSYEEIIVSRI